jgi:prophage tail gpP-like protein
MVLKTAKGEFSYWDDISVNLNLASRASTFSFTGCMNAESMFLFKPFAYEECEVWIVDEELNIKEKLITGFITNPGVGKSSKPSLQTISGFSRPGILDSVCYPPSMYPLQFKNKTLKQLATDICDKFDLTLKIHDGAVGACNSSYTNIKCEETDTIGNFLD